MKVRWILSFSIGIAIATAWSQPHDLSFQRGFVESQGGDYHYSARIGKTRIFCRSRGISIVSLRMKGDSIVQQRFDLDFPLAPQAIIPTAERPESYTFVHGHTNHRARSFEQIRYVSVAPGVDVIFRWTRSALKYDIIIHPGGELDKLHLLLRGAKILEQCARTGTLTFQSGTERFTDYAPIAYQTSGRQQHHVQVAYSVVNDSTFGYRVVGAYNPAFPLVIDPAIVWSSYLGGSQEDAANDVTTDQQGYIYVAGNTLSVDFPRRGTTTNRGRQNMVVAKFTATGQHLWSTYFGGERDEVAKAIVTDGTMLYVGGWSSSPSIVLDQPYPTRAGGAFDAVILALTTDGTYTRGTFLGGSREELVNALALRRDGSLIAVGRTNSPDFPIAQAQQQTLAGDNDLFITALALPTLHLLWSTYYGGTNFDEAYGVAVDPAGSVFVTGVTVSSDFPTANAYQPRAPALDNAFVVSLSSSGRRLWSSYLGGSDYDLGNRIVYWNGRLYVVGTTSSEDFPIVGDRVAQPVKSGYNDAFVACISVTGMPMWSTFWGGRMAESGFGVAVLPTGDVVIAGSTSSMDFPRRRSILWSPRGGDDVFVALFRDGHNEWSLTFGGSGDDILSALALLLSGDIVGVGETRSHDFEPLINPQYQASTAASNRSDCFLFRLCTFAPRVQAPSPNPVICNGRSVELWASDSADIASIHWNTGSTQRRIVVTTAGEYWFTATSRSGCTVQSDTLHIMSASAAPVQLDTISPRSSLRICEGEQLGFVVRGRYRSHAWFDDRGGLITTDDTLWVRSSGRYHAIVEDSNGCVLQSPSQTVEVIPRPALTYRRFFADGSSIVISTDTIATCRGDTIRIEVERPATATCKWSDGIDQCRRTITTDQVVSVTVTDSAGCAWTLSTLTVRFGDRSAPLIYAPDTMCAGTPFDLWAVGEGGTPRWTIPPTVQVLAVAPDSTWWKLVAPVEGVYSIIAWYSNPCGDTTSHTVVVLPEPTIRIHANRTFICPGEQSVLTAPSGYPVYWWNGSLGNSTYIVYDSGWYHLIVTSAGGCTATDSIYIGRRRTISTGTVTLQFGAVRIGQSASMSFIIHNPADTAALVTFALAYGQTFRIESLTTSPFELAPLASSDVTITFTPHALGQIHDTVLVIQLQPCVDTIRVVLVGSGIQSDEPIRLAFAIDDITITPLDESTHIPIYCWQVGAQSYRIDSIVVGMSYNPTMLMPRSIEPGRLEIHPRQQGRGYLVATIPLDSIPTTPRAFPIATLTAAVLLGDREEDRNEISEVSVVPQSPLSYTPAVGTVRYENLCRAGGVRLLGHYSHELLQVLPNPSDGEVSIRTTSPENGTMFLRVSTLEGRSLWHIRWSSKAGQQYTITPPPIPPGIYMAQVQTPSGKVISAGFIVVR